MTPNTIVCGDALEVLCRWPDECVDCIVTSPPYFGLRDYKISGQQGLESSPQKYIANMATVFFQLRRVLKQTGTLWLNMGDSYAGSGKGGNPEDSPHVKQATNRGNLIARKGDRANSYDRQSKDMLGIPWRLAFALQDSGWILRSDIIWHKPNPMPHPVKDRPTTSHEYIFLLAKSSRYYYDWEAILEDSVTDDPRRPYGSEGAWAMDGRPDHQKHGGEVRRPASVKRGGFNGKTNALPGREAFRAFTEQRNKRTVWTVATCPFKGAHFATFPEALIDPCIRAGCPVGGIVLDPYMGAGTTALVAAKLGRQYAGIELNPKYIDMATRRLGLLAHMAGTVDTLKKGLPS